MEYEVAPDERLSTAVVRAVSAVEGLEPNALRPLAEVVDPEALDALFGPREDGGPRIGGRVTLVYSDCRITVENGEYLSLELLEPRMHDASGPASNCRGSR